MIWRRRSVTDLICRNPELEIVANLAYQIWGTLRNLEKLAKIYIKYAVLLHVLTFPEHFRLHYWKIYVCLVLSDCSFAIWLNFEWILCSFAAFFENICALAQFGLCKKVQPNTIELGILYHCVFIYFMHLKHTQIHYMCILISLWQNTPSAY